jgi:hypothetical protein
MYISEPQERQLQGVSEDALSSLLYLPLHVKTKNRKCLVQMNNKVYQISKKTHFQYFIYFKVPPQVH